MRTYISTKGLISLGFFFSANENGLRVTSDAEVVLEKEVKGERAVRWLASERIG